MTNENSMVNEQLLSELDKYIGLSKKSPKQAAVGTFIGVLIVSVIVLVVFVNWQMPTWVLALTPVVALVAAFFAARGEMAGTVANVGRIKNIIQKNKDLVLSDFKNAEEMVPNGLRVGSYYLFAKGNTIVRIVDINRFIRYTIKSYFVTVGVELRADVVRVDEYGSAENETITLCGMEAAKSKERADEIALKVMTRKEEILQDRENIPQGY